MRKLIWTACGFAAAALLAEYLLPIPGLPYIAAALAACALLCLPVKRVRGRAMLLLLSAAAGLLYWWGWYQLRVAPCEALAGQDVTVTARVTDWPTVREDYSRVSVTIAGGAPRVPAYLYLYHEDLPELSPGDTITCTVRVRSAMLRGDERAHTLTAAGRCLCGYFKGEIEVRAAERTWLYFPQYLARYVQDACADLFPGRTGVFMKALLTGDKDDLYDDVELYGDMRAAGVLHAVAVSGMHVFVLIALLQMLIGRGKRSVLLCLPVMLVFVLLSGAGASVVRAAVMQAIYMGAPLFDREDDPPSALSAALLILLLANPMSIGGIGLQLSFACMLGFALILPRLSAGIGRVQRRFRRLPKPVRSLPGVILANLAATVSATAFSIPVAAYYFGTVPLLSPAANLLALPVIELLFAGGYVLCLVNAVLPVLARWIAWVLAWGVRWCFLVFRGIAGLPFACLYTADGAAVAWLVFVYTLFLGWALLRRGKRKLIPAIPCLLAVIGLCLVFLRQDAALRLGRRELAVLDVGQGECAVLLDKDSSVVMDCGGAGLDSAGNLAADRLLSAGKRHVDLLVLTHLDDDHVNGVETLLYRLPVGRVVIPAGAAEEEDAAEIRTLAERYGAEVCEADEPSTVALGDLTLTLTPVEAGSADNDRGVVVRADFPGASAYVMGDAGEAAERELLAGGAVSDADILVVGHHGSATASGAMFLRAVQAQTAVISVGVNSYGHPAEETLDRLSLYCDTVLRTDEAGTVVIPMRETERLYGA